MASPKRYLFIILAIYTVIILISVVVFSLTSMPSMGTRSMSEANKGNLSDVRERNSKYRPTDDTWLQSMLSFNSTQPKTPIPKIKKDKVSPKGTAIKSHSPNSKSRGKKTVKNKKVKVKKDTPRNITAELLAQNLKAKEDIEKYLTAYKERCEKEWENRTLPIDAKPLCDCVPDTLVGFRNISLDFAPLNLTLVENPEVEPGGHWAPRACTPRARVVVIVPFRDRDHHLSVLLKYLHPILQGQQLNYTIIVVEQNYPKTFNKASLMNIAFAYAREVLNPDCVIFHDVDIIPEDGRHIYNCQHWPLHLGAYHSRHKYRLIYSRIFGAVTAFRPKTFEKINGFSNRFFGWGGEDDDMSARLREHKQWIVRDPRAVAGYTAIVHTRDPGNVQRNRWGMVNKLYHDRDTRHDGLNTLRYLLNKRRLQPLYTWLLVDVLNDETKIGFDIS